MPMQLRLIHSTSQTPLGNFLTLVGSIPESKTGGAGNCILALMLEVEKLALKHNIPLTGHCTDSAANKLASPTSYIHWFTT